MEQRTLTATIRDKSGKSAARKLRAAGRVPGVIYGRNFGPVPVSLDQHELATVVAHGGYHAHLFQLSLDGPEAPTPPPLVLIKEVHRNPTTDQLWNVDLYRVSLEEKVTATVRVILRGEPPAVRQGCVLEQVLHEVQVESLPTDLPEMLEADIAEMSVGDTLRVRDLSIPANVQILLNADDLIAVLSPPKLTAEEAPAQPTVAPEAEATEEAQEES